MKYKPKIHSNERAGVSADVIESIKTDQRKLGDNYKKGLKYFKKRVVR